MGTYNPDAGLIVGQEWVPIVNDSYVLNPSEEIGWTFQLPTAETVSTGKIYVKEPTVNSLAVTDDPSTDLLYAMMALYPEGTEAATGPMRQSIIELSGGAISGTHLALSPGTPTVLAALYYTGDVSFITYTTTTADTGSDICMNFNFNGHTELIGKRITKMELLYTFVANDEFVSKCTAKISQNFGATPGTITSRTNMASSADFLSNNGANFDFIPSIPLPVINEMVDSPAAHAAIGFDRAHNVYPFTYDKLKLLDVGAGAYQQSISVRILAPAGVTNSSMGLEYAALRVTYCEEQRVAFGGLNKHLQTPSVAFDIRSPALVPNDAFLPAGSYSLMLDGGKLDTEIFGARELYQLPGQQGLVVERTDRLGQAFEKESSDQLVMASIHEVSGVIIAGPHAYGPQDQSAVYIWPDTFQTRQGVINASRAGTVDYPVARFYARRFGDTSSALSLTSETNPAVTQSISVADFDLLPDIAEGWKQVDLRFDPPVPTFDNSGTVEQYYWSSGTAQGDSWQVLIASSVARDAGIPSLYLTGTSAPLKINYGADTAFAYVNAVSEVAMDATLLFAQEMPAVSGLALSQETLPVTGIGLDCGLPPHCMPTGISYHQLTWDALDTVSMPASGFGFYELQRSDDIDPTWNTILLASSPLVTGFSDFEARTGVESHYRIRFDHRLLFFSPWSAEVDGTIPPPGVTGSTPNLGNSTLIFTSNERQNGSRSLAYTMQWSGSVQEGFTFLEADDVVLQKMFDRDYQVAFRPLERGGERFTRDILVQAASVPDGLIQHGFTSLRDLAWDTLSYVCVRDELGDRWLATVIVPEGTVQRDRQLYMAQIQVVEVTAIPSIVFLPDATAGAGGPFASCIPALWDGLPGWDVGCWS